MVAHFTEKDLGKLVKIEFDKRGDTSIAKIARSLGAASVSLSGIIKKVEKNYFTLSYSSPPPFSIIKERDVYYRDVKGYSII
jgi:hypothetical protein